LYRRRRSSEEKKKREAIIGVASARQEEDEKKGGKSEFAERRPMMPISKERTKGRGSKLCFNLISRGESAKKKKKGER